MPAGTQQLLTCWIMLRILDSSRSSCDYTERLLLDCFLSKLAKASLIQAFARYINPWFPPVLMRADVLAVAFLLADSSAEPSAAPGPTKRPWHVSHSSLATDRWLRRSGHGPAAGGQRRPFPARRPRDGAPTCLSAWHHQGFAPVWIWTQRGIDFFVPT